MTGWSLNCHLDMLMLADWLFFWDLQDAGKALCCKLLLVKLINLWRYKQYVKCISNKNMSFVLVLYAPKHAKKTYTMEKIQRVRPYQILPNGLARGQWVLARPWPLLGWAWIEPIKIVCPDYLNQLFFRCWKHTHVVWLETKPKSKKKTGLLICDSTVFIHLPIDLSLHGHATASLRRHPMFKKMLKGTM